MRTNVTARVVGHIDDEMIGTLLPEVQDPLYYQLPPLDKGRRVEGSYHHDSNRRIGQHGEVGDVVRTGDVGRSRDERLGQVDSCSEEVEIGQACNELFTLRRLSYMAKVQRHIRDVGRPGSVRRAHIGLVINAVGGISSRAVARPERLLIRE